MSEQGRKDVIADLTALRGIVGPEPKEFDLVQLLNAHGGDVNAAANAFFEGGIPPDGPTQHAGNPAVPVARPVARPADQQHNIISVTCPPGVNEGDEIQVTTPAGLMRVRVPNGVQKGGTFLIRLPTQAPVAQAVPSTGAPIHGQPVGGPSHGYPGQAQAASLSQQPVVQQQQQQPQVIVVQGSPYYGGYGYGGYGYGYDPFFPMMGGMMGGMLLADAMFW
jgi:hypothetical protein